MIIAQTHNIVIPAKAGIQIENSFAYDAGLV